MRWYATIEPTCFCVLGDGDSQEGTADLLGKEVISMARKSVSPGTPAPTSGQWRPTGGGAEVTVPKGHRLPPPPRPGQKWVNVDPTKNKSGRG